MTRLLSLFLYHANWFLICSRSLFLYWTHSHLRHYPLFVNLLFLFIVGYYFVHFLSCQTTDILISYLLSRNYLTYTFMNHRNSTFSCFCVCEKKYYIYLTHHLHFILFLCVTFVIALFWFKFHRRNKIHWFMEFFQVLTILNRILNG